MNAEHINEMFAGLDQSWVDLIKTEMKPTTAKTLKALNAWMINEAITVDSLSPSHKNIFNFARGFTLADTKVVILGQDPYPKKASATGRAFDMPKTIKPLQPSLKNIYKALFKYRLISHIPKHGSLENWCKQGVVLLNTALTTLETVANAHKDIWNDFTDELIAKISSKTREVVWILWGEPAKKKAKLINATNNHLVLTWCHPSPMVKVNSDEKNPLSFINNDNFIKCNEFLISKGKEAINWRTEEDLPPGTNQKKLFVHYDEVRSDALYLFTDGSAERNGKPDCVASYAYAAIDNRGCTNNKAMINIDETKVLYDGSGLVPTDNKPATNQRGELLGAFHALAYVIDRELWKEYSTCILVTDSKYTLDIICSWWDKWVREDATEKHENMDIIPELMEFVETIRAKFKEFQVVHVNSHRDPPPQKTDAYFFWHYNDYVDKLATKMVYG